MAMEEMQWLHMHITSLDIFRKPLNIQVDELIPFTSLQQETNMTVMKNVDQSKH